MNYDKEIRRLEMVNKDIRLTSKYGGGEWEKGYINANNCMIDHLKALKQEDIILKIPLDIH